MSLNIYKCEVLGGYKLEVGTTMTYRKTEQRQTVRYTSSPLASENGATGEFLIKVEEERQNRIYPVKCQEQNGLKAEK